MTLPQKGMGKGSLLSGGVSGCHEARMYGAKEDPWIIADCPPDVNLGRAGKLQADVAKQQAGRRWGDGAG